MTDHLLPPSAPPLMQVLDRAESRITAIPVPIDRLKRPFEVPEAFLPFLAHEEAVDVWDHAWPAEHKRSVISRSLPLQFVLGTPAAIRGYVSFTGAEVVQFVRPPQAVYLTGTLTKAEMDDWLRSMPQIRVYLAKEFGDGTGRDYLDDGFLDDGFLDLDLGRALYGRAARLWDRGVETRLTVVDLTAEREARQGLRLERVSLPGDAGAALMLDDGFLDEGFADGEARRAETVTWRQEVAYEHGFSALSLKSAVPALEPVDVRAERITGEGDAGADLHLGDRGAAGFWDEDFLGPDRSEWMMYDRIVLHDPVRARPRVDALSFLDHDYFGMAPKTAYARIDLRQTAPQPACFLDDGFFGDGCLAPADDKRRLESMRAAVAAKSLRDNVLVSNRLSRPLTFADGVPLDGSFAFGDLTSFRL